MSHLQNYLPPAIFPRNKPADTAKQLETNRQVNERIATLDDGKMVTFLDINKVFLGPDGKVHEDIMQDFLHPNEHGYQLWADAMEPTLDKLSKSSDIFRSYSNMPPGEACIFCLRKSLWKSCHSHSLPKSRF